MEEALSAKDPQTIDVRQIPKPQRHARIFELFARLQTGEQLVLLADHEPQNLRREFERDQPGAFDWQARALDPGQWRVLLTRLAATPLPRVLANTTGLAAAAQGSGAIWKLEPEQRDLDANIIALGPGEQIGEHRGPDLDVLIHVFSGSGVLHTETGSVPLAVGDVLYLPARSRRRFVAADAGLRYFSVHQRKKTLGLMPTLRPST